MENVNLQVSQSKGMSRTVLGIVGSYRKGGTIDQTVSAVQAAAAEGGAATEKIYLLDARIEFCTNCRRCTQHPGPDPGRCFLEDDMAGLIERIEGADALVLGAPVNFGNVNALTQRFLERLVGYSFWPRGQAAPKPRRKGRPQKPAVLVTASAMPAPMGRLFTGSLRGLKLGATAVGARPVATLFVGLAAMREHRKLPERMIRKARRAGQKLAA
jgi:NAD(P)H-dependent FMN reductase